MPSALSRFLAGKPWKEALVWLCALAALFFSTYSFANAITAAKDFVPVIVFDWERHIPFLAWTIVPYWSIDFLYGLSLFFCRTKQELRVLVARLIAASLLCVSFFLLFPLRFSFTRPEAQGFFGFLFRSLESFDQPFNQAPSLHICLLLILLAHYHKFTPAKFRWVLYTWAALVAISIHTTFQHHSIDLITGAWAGCFCLWLLPEGGWQAWREWRPLMPLRAQSLSARYGVVALVLLFLAWLGGGWFWALAYPALASACVAAQYSLIGPTALGKYSGCSHFGAGSIEGTGLTRSVSGAPGIVPLDGVLAGKRSPATAFFLAPYFAGATLSRWYYQRKAEPYTQILPDLWVGGYPSRLPVPGCGVLDLCSEFSRAGCSTDVPYCSVPMPDLMIPARTEMAQAQQCLAALHSQGPVLVHCALGYTRSVSVMACYLAQQGHAPDIQAALAMIGEKRKGIVIRKEYEPYLAGY